MRFESDEFYNRLKSEFYSERNAEIHQELLEIVYRRTERLFPQYRDDMLDDLKQEAAVRVFTNAIHSFLENEVYALSEHREFMRLKWLKHIIRNAGIDYLRRERVRTGVYLKNTQPEEESGMDNSESGDKRWYLSNRSLNEPLNRAEPDGDTLGSSLAPQNGQDMLEDMISHSQVDDAFRQLFSLPGTKPEKQVVCAFVVLMEATGYMGGPKQLNKTVAELLDGMTLFDAADAIRRMLFQVGADPASMSDLMERLMQTDAQGVAVGETRIVTDTRTVTHQFSSTRKRLRRDASDDGISPFQGKDGKEK